MKCTGVSLWLCAVILCIASSARAQEIVTYTSASQSASAMTMAAPSITTATVPSVIRDIPAVSVAAGSPPPDEALHAEVHAHAHMEEKTCHTEYRRDQFNNAYSLRVCN